MNATQQVGIWMDHSTANIIDDTSNTQPIKTITNSFTHNDKVEALSQGEGDMHHKEQQLQGVYYTELSNIIKNYSAVILFGPTDAKLELLNLLKSNHHFDKINIYTATTGKMTNNQKQAFVHDYFKHKLIPNTITK